MYIAVPSKIQFFHVRPDGGEAGPHPGHWLEEVKRIESGGTSAPPHNAARPAHSGDVPRSFQGISQNHKRPTSDQTNLSRSSEVARRRGEMPIRKQRTISDELNALF